LWDLSQEPKPTNQTKPTTPINQPTKPHHTNQSINRSINQSINETTPHQSINQSINQSGR
jgi:hypothetical protein